MKDFKNAPNNKKKCKKDHFGRTLANFNTSSVRNYVSNHHCISSFTQCKTIKGLKVISKLGKLVLMLEKYMN